MPTSDAIEMFLTARRGKGLKPTSIKWYRLILNEFCRQCPLLPETPEPIWKFLDSCEAGDERRHGYFRAVSAMYNFLDSRFNGSIPNPMAYVTGPKRTKKDPKPCWPQELTKVWNHEQEPVIRAAIQFLIDSGARLGELHELTADDLHETQWGYVASIKGKTGERIVPISYETYHQLMIHLPIKWSTDWLGRKIAAACRTAGVNRSAVNFRHSFGTYWEGDEGTLQRIMGHTNFKTTQGYRATRLQMMQKQHQKYSPFRTMLSGQLDML